MAHLSLLDTNKQNIIEELQKAVQSANLNFLIGSGCSKPAISTLGNIENKIEKSRKEKPSETPKIVYDFLKPFVPSFVALYNNKTDTKQNETLSNYKIFLETISKILYERKSNILHKQANIFTTNYDLFIEKAYEELTDNFILNDGFKRIASLKRDYEFSASNFFDIVYNTGNLYNYQVEIPSINLIKLHGSLNWVIEEKTGKIISGLKHIKKAIKLLHNIRGGITKTYRKFNNLFSLILPSKAKFKETLLNRIYYDLLRIYANELDKENTLLIADEHILDITTRALKNPTLKLIIFVYDCMDCWDIEKKFSSFNNVDIIGRCEDNKYLTFATFNEFLKRLLPKDNFNEANLHDREGLKDEESSN